MSKVAITGNPSGTGTLTIAAPDTNTDRTLTLPNNSGTVLTSASDIPAANLTGSLPAGMGGKVLQVLQAFKSDTFSHASTSWTPITGLSVNITPTSATSKILVMFSVSGSATGGGYSFALKIVRNGSTDIGIADAAGSRTRSTAKIQASSSSHTFCCSAQFLDSPSTTSSTNYRVDMAVQAGGTGVINRTGGDTDGTDPYHARSTSVLTVMEIAA